MDKIQELKENNLITNSIDCSAFVVLKTNADVSIVVNENGYKLFCIAKNDKTVQAYNTYKNWKDNNIINVNIREYNNIIKKLKNLCKDYIG